MDGCRREDMGAARERYSLMMSFWVVPGQLVAGQARRLVFRPVSDVERQQPGRRRVDRHGGVHAAPGECWSNSSARMSPMVTDRHAHLADLAPGQGVVRCRSRSGSADRRRWRARSGRFSRGSCDRARLEAAAVLNGRRRCGTARAGRGSGAVTRLRGRDCRPWTPPRLIFVEHQLRTLDLGCAAVQYNSAGPKENKC